MLCILLARRKQTLFASHIHSIFGHAQAPYMETAPNLHIWRQPCSIYKQANHISKYGHISIWRQPHISIYGDRSAQYISRPTRPYTEKREALTWKSQCADLCSGNSQTHTQTDGNFEPCYIVTGALAFAITLSLLRNYCTLQLHY